jgi:CYTH domain-containing protein
MALEIEQKFIIHGEDGFKKVLGQADGPVISRYIKQAYMVDNEAQGALWRVRLNTPLNTDGLPSKTEHSSACWTFKQKTPDPMTRIEIEQPLDVAVAKELVEKSSRIVEKIRYIVPFKGQNFELDEFKGEHEGLYLLELEKSSRETPITLPNGVSKADEVTGVKEYSNDELARKTEFLRSIGQDKAKLIKSFKK